MRLFHGTDPDSALALVNGQHLDIGRVQQRHVHGELGFYLAEECSDAEAFGAYHGPSAVIAFDVDDDAMAELETAGARLRRIAGTPPPYFRGRELYVPPGAFQLFDRLRARGAVRARP